MGAIPKLIDGLLRAAALLLALACLAAAAAGQGGRVDPTLDMFNHFEPVWLVGALLAAPIGRQDRPTLAVAALAALICAVQIAPELKARLGPARPAPGAEQLRLIQFNVWSRNTDPAGTARWLLAQDADVVVLEEAFQASTPIARALSARYPYRLGCSSDPAACATFIFSRRRPLAGGPLQGSGLASTWARLPGAGGPFIVVGLQATHPYPPPGQQQDLAMFARALGRFAPRRLVVAGDFNSTPWSFTLRGLDRALPLTRRTHGIATWPAAEAHLMGRAIALPFPVLPIDQVYAGPGWRTLKVSRGPKLGSDHRPLVVDLQAAP
jgi:endonuclease/exonuclease/phosphatase (EEP) superfamily protein YafD